MSNRLITNYTDWQKVSEQEAQSSKAKVKVGGWFNDKSVKVTPIGKDKFKLSVRNNPAIVDSNSKMTEKGWNDIKEWMNKDRNLTNITELINQIDRYKVIYKVKKNAGTYEDTPLGKKPILMTKHQFIIFDIVPAERYKGAAVQYLTQEEADNFKQKAASQYGKEESEEGTSNTGGSANIGGDSKDATSSNTDTTKNKEGENKKESVKVEGDYSLLNKENIPFRYKDRGDHVKQYQNLVINKVKGTELFKTPPFVRFNKYGADGIYGKNTKEVTRILKDGFKLGDADSSIVTQALIDKLKNDKITESYLWYGRIIEQFDMQAALDSAARVEKEHNLITKTKSTAKHVTSKPTVSKPTPTKPVAVKKETIDDVEDADIGRKLNSAMEYFGTRDNDLIANIQRIKNPNQLTRVMTFYYKNYGEKLLDAINNELNNTRDSDEDVITTINRHFQKIGAKSRITGS